MNYSKMDTGNQIPNTEIYKSNLSFVSLPQILRQAGGSVPEWATQQGYDPTKDEQLAIFGDQATLELFIKDHKLNPEQHPIHDAKMGMHIDIYTDTLIEKLKSTYPLTPVRNYWEKEKVKKRTN